MCISAWSHFRLNDSDASTPFAKEKYFDYFVVNIVDSLRLKFDGLCSAFACTDYIRVDSAAPWSASTAACHARGLIVAPSCTQYRSEARHRTLAMYGFAVVHSPIQHCSGARHHLAFVCGSSSTRSSTPSS
jgi:hypothetical protein